MEYTGAALTEMHRSMTYGEIATATGMSYNTVRERIRKHTRMRDSTPPRLAASSYPVYNAPLKMEGDALILPDTEFPFHDADFVNRCLDLAQTWDIDQCIIAGDALHFDSLSQWEAEWAEAQRVNSLTEDAETRLREFIQSLPVTQQGAGMEILASITGAGSEPTELAAAKRALTVIGECFARVDYVIGNHDDRFVRALKSPIMPEHLLGFLGVGGAKQWRIAPYFYSVLTSGGETFRVEHPRSAAANTAVRLADKYECSVIMGHSHLQDVRWSTSGRHYAIHAGCCVDEMRLPYAAQRSSNSPAHKLGAVMVREGAPWVLHDRVDWTRLALCK